MIYLDNAATTLQKPEKVHLAVQEAMMSCASVGRSGHDAAIRASEQVYQCREFAASMFDTEPERVVFTFNATHGLNIAIHSQVKPGDRVVISGFEHNAVVRPLHHIGAKIIIAGKRIFDPADTLEDFSRKITPDTKAVICTHVSNVFGYILPVEEIASMCLKRGVSFILDASQSAGVLPVSVKKLGAAFIAMPGHKGLYGPQGTGILLCGRMPDPIIQGGTGSRSSEYTMPDFLPDRAEAGTHNVPGISGLLEGMRYVSDMGINQIFAHEKQLMKTANDRLHGICRTFFGDPDHQSGVLSLQFDQTDCEVVAHRLASMGIAVRAGLHCAPLAHRSAGTFYDGTVRISFSSFTTPGDLEELFEALQMIAMGENSSVK